MGAAVIPDPALRDRFRAAVSAAGIGPVNPFGIEAAVAAYTAGEDWLEALLGYLWDNYGFLRRFFAERLPRAGVFPLEGTYLVWADFRAYKLSDRELTDRLLRRGKVWLDGGSMFGPEGEGFQRINIACPRPLLEDGLERIARSLEGL
jgi:cystathionine beta-lyase